MSGLYLLATTDKLRITTGAAISGGIKMQGSYIQYNATTGAYSNTGLFKNSVTTATDTDVLVGPGSTDYRIVREFTVRNPDTTTACDITISFNDNGTIYEKHKVTLQPGDCLEYAEGVGFVSLTANSFLDRVIIMAADSTHATAATFADIAGMSCPMLSGKKYSVVAHLFHANNASTTGSQFGFNIGAAPTVSIFGNYSGVTNSVTAGVMALGTATARDTAITAQTTGQTATGYTILAGMIQPSADGTFALRATSEVTVASGLIVKANSFMTIKQER